VAKKQPLKQFTAHVRATYEEQWLVEARTAEEAQALLEAGDTMDETRLELVDWEVKDLKDEGEA
jgi:hypothetical protein